MKKKITAAIVLFAAALFAVLAVFAFSQNKVTARADAYSFNISAYDVVYDINTDCSMGVTETITINYSGYASTGFMRDIPIDGNARVQNLTVNEISGGEEISVAYDVYFYSDYDGYNYITADIGDTSNKTNTTHTYVLRYDYIVPKQDTLLALNPIGTNWDCTIANASVTINAPDGFIAESTKCYIGRYGSTNQSEYTITGNTVSVSCELLSAYNGISFDLYFESGVLTSHFNAAPWIALIVGVIILAALIVIKFASFNNPPLTPVVNFTAPDDMDPLAVGQLIDGQISNEDVTSLIYYWADKGYIKINMQDEKDPVLIRIFQNLPANAPEYQKDMYAAIFARGESVKISSLSMKFYNVIENVKRKATVKKSAMYDGKSITAATIFAVLGGLFMAVTPVALAMIQISSKMLNLAYLLAVVPAIVIFMLTQTVYFFRYKFKTAIMVLLYIAVLLLGGVLVAIYAFCVPYAAFETAPKIIAGGISIVIAMLSVTLIVRTKKYNDQLNGIIGFRNFILYTEKDKLEAMLEEDPQLYYHILPYAQVMGVTDKWEDKFKALTVEPPAWMVDPFGTYVSFVVINRSLRTSFMMMNRNMASRPPSSGGGPHGGGFSGGFGGGVGGGFGGGGGRGR